MEINSNDLTTMLVSVLCGGLLGLERQYLNKSAGLRTIVLICLGSTIFTMVSQRVGGSEDRIAANIITGIGFIGAGVIFKENYNVRGLTSAAVIWISSAIGMVIGIREFYLAYVLTFIVLIVLSGFAQLEALMDFINHKRTYHITFQDDKLTNIELILDMARDEKLKASVKHLSKTDSRLLVNFEIKGNKKHFHLLTQKFIAKPEILGLEH
ncbi:MAG: MgtC/SapB family protein [Phormidesmis sp. FL-bin-119]|nr:MgtC/SapB family protein [Pedobacter sp.]